MVLLHNSISQKHSPEQLSSMISCRESDVHYKEICKKHLHSNYVQMLLRLCLTTHEVENLQCTSNRFSFGDVPLPADVSCDVVDSAKGNKTSPKKQALHLTITCWAQCVDHTMHRDFSVDISSWEVWCAFLGARFITRELAFSFSLWHGDLK